MHSVIPFKQISHLDIFEKDDNFPEQFAQFTVQDSKCFYQLLYHKNLDRPILEAMSNDSTVMNYFIVDSKDITIHTFLLSFIHHFSGKIVNTYEINIEWSENGVKEKDYTDYFIQHSPLCQFYLTW